MAEVRPFQDRAEAGRLLAERLLEVDLTDPIVLALPRGGVPVGAVVARGLRAPLEVFVARKIGAPGHEEYGIGAVAEGGAMVSDRPVLAQLGITDADLSQLAEVEEQRVDALVQRYRAGRPLPDLTGRDVIVVDDGLATGVTAQVALQALRRMEPSQLVLAVPVGAADTARRLADVADQVVCVHEPVRFHAVGAWYRCFDPVSDAEVLAALQEDFQGGRR